MMDEDPRDHDFDQRHDGPFDQPRPSVTVPREALQNTVGGSPTAANTVVVPDTTSSATSGSPTKHNAGMLATPTISEPQTTSSNHTIRSSPSLSVLEKNDTPPPRKSVQLVDIHDPSGERNGSVAGAYNGRKSLQSARPRPSMSSAHRRHSRDFDVRRDGPYGRPSLNMVRRRSSIIDLADAIPAHPDTNTVDVELGSDDPIAETVAFEPEPPPLNYSLWARKRAIAIFWTLIVIDCIAMPIALYFGLWYGTSLTPNIVFSIVTAALGGVSILEYFIRLWRLVKKDSTCRVIGARRSYLDWFHWNFTAGWMIIMVELIVGTVPEHPPIRLLSMPVVTMMYVFGTELLVVDMLRYFRQPAPIRISSIPKGAQLRPAIYSIIEDVVAVDGNGGTAFREALNRRYEASHVFRAMLRRLGAYWAFGAQTTAVVLTILIFTIHPEAAYVIGWTVPFVWAGIWTLGTIWYVKRKLREEKIAWAEEIAESQHCLQP